MNKIYIEARAKINLSLNVLNKRSDGYHNLESIFQPINLYDELFIEKNNVNNIIFYCSKPSLNNNNNIIIIAYNYLKKLYPNQVKGVTVRLIKHIPLGAGLGGGSSDCASFLLALNSLFKLNLSTTTLIDIASKIGADVTPCFFKRALVAHGIGEKIKDIDTNMKYYLVLIKPKLSLSTKAMFNKLDNLKDIKQEFNTKNLIHALETNNLNLLCNNLYNVFEEATYDLPIINNLKTALKDEGALATLLTGSGSCVYGIFKNKTSAKNAYNNLNSKYNTFLCSSFNNIL